MFRKYVRPIAAAAILVITISAFAYYTSSHPELLRQLTVIPPSKLILLLILYGIFFGTLLWIQRATLSMCDIKLIRKENVLIVMYSSIINFFGPLQSGPAFRAAYLKHKHNINLRKYTLATLLYYGFYAIFSGLFLMSYYVGIWAPIASVALVVMTPLLARAGLLPKRFRKLSLNHIGNLALATLAQVSIVTIIFYIELSSFGRHIGAIQDMVYTGAANFALFVSITPGAIGFRETFLLFSQRLHHILSDQIVYASLVDRGVYILFLAILIVIASAIHAKSYLSLQPQGPKSEQKTDKISQKTEFD